MIYWLSFFLFFLIFFQWCSFIYFNNLRI
jgi:hypothetical protein